MAELIPNRRLVDKGFITKLANEPVKEFAISAGARYGDNVMGTLLSIDVKTQSNNILNLVIKSVLPMTGVIDRKTLDDARNLVQWNVFPKEICYYKIIRPIFLEACEKPEDFAHFSSPKYFSSYTDTHGLNDYLSLEDLRPSGYKMANKFKGLGYEEVAAALKELAFFHAMSYFLLDSKHEKFCSMAEDPNSTLNDFNWESCDGGNLQLFFNGIVSSSVELLRESGQLDVADKMGRFVRDGHNFIMTLWRKTKEDGRKYFQCFIHADLWTNNILFQYANDGKTVQDVKFVDFQRSRIGNVYEDLLYFIFTSTTVEFRKNHLQTCLGIYFQEFENCLQNKKCNLPTGFTELELRKTFHENLEYGLSYTLFAVPYQLGLKPPPPSPMTPIEGDFSNNVFFPPQDTALTASPAQEEESSTDTKSSFLKTIKAEVDTLKIAMRNSLVAKKRLKELAEEMVEHN
ncbi:unnamed protein product [Orchesella dallaii]|uniref:CHK kinase-like domain-containing protein n=1 Tax=Orchesella dallaii TaxID=48710 RepID=A0ABP1S008_9HEXA